ncbi:MAG TPA: DNA topoisomerase IB [Xanthobacteraceae bacterium]|nr:DNA topoisomerase IB [Xanthobacteraceae bacterium]
MDLAQDSSEEGSRGSVAGVRRGVSASAFKQAKRLGLIHVTAEALSIRRLRHGKGFRYVDRAGAPIRDPAVLQRLKSLAVPPAYEDVLYAAQANAHLQALGRDAAGRLQYRYHPEWEKVRELRKARRLAALAEALPKIRRTVGRCLAGAEPCREFALAAVIELVARTAIRPGDEGHTRFSGNRGATTLLKSNVAVAEGMVTLRFRAKGGKKVAKQVAAPRLCEALAALLRLPGRRLFQYRSQGGEIRAVTARSVNTFLREMAGAPISLKDFRTLLASVTVLDVLSRETPANSKRARRRQVLQAIRLAAEDLANTPAICARSYVHETVISAFEEGVLDSFAETLRSTRSKARREKVLGEVVAAAAG